MARAAQDKAYNNFSAGFITEATGLSYPENSCQDIDNCVIELKGKVRRRKGLLRESATSFSPASNYYDTAYANSRYKWNNPAGVNNVDFEVVQTGRYILFFVDGLQYSVGLKAFSIDLDQYKVNDSTTTQVEQSEVDMAAGKGKLLIVSKYINPILVTYDRVADDITTTILTLVERDFEGQEDGLNVDTRPTTLTDEHEYNLQNQGWNAGNITAWDTARGDFPSNADIDHLGYYINPSTGLRAWEEDNVISFTSNSPAPKGHFIREVFTPGYVTGFGVSLDNDTFTKSGDIFTITTETAHGFTAGNQVTITGTRYTKSGDFVSVVSIDGSYTIVSTPTATTYTVSIPGKPSIGVPVSDTHAGRSESTVPLSGTINEAYRPSCVAFFAGRAWYGGTESDRLGDVIHFSQVIELDKQFPLCHQVNDPTAEEFSDLLDTDGGRIKIGGLGFLRKMLPMGEFLLVFSSTGVWAIGPGNKGGFTPTSFSLRKLTSPGCSSKQSVVDAKGTPLFWSPSGIFEIVEDTNTGFLTASSLTETTIQSYYNELGNGIESAKGVYDESLKRVLWLHKDSDDTAPSKVLVYSHSTKAFYKWSLSVGGTVVPTLISTVQTSTPSENRVKVVYRDVVSAASVYFWAEFDDSTFYDFTGSTLGATSYNSYILTAQEVLGDLQRNKQGTFLHSFFQRTETGFTLVGDELQADNPSGCTVVAKWDWHNTSAGGRWTDSQRAYRYRRPYTPSGEADTFDTGEEIVYTKLKIRGKGKSIAVQYNSEVGKDFQLLGYSIPFTIAEA